MMDALTAIGESMAKIRFRHYPPNRLNVTKYYGIYFENHPKRKALDVYWGKHVFVWFVGREY